MVDFPEGGEGNGSRSGIGRRNIEGPQQVGVERIWEALGMGKSEGGELGIWIALGGDDQVLPAIDAEPAEAAEKFLGCASDDFAESGGGLHLHGAETFVSAAHIPEEVAGWLDGDIGSGEIDGFHAEVEFIIDSRETGESLGSDEVSKKCSAHWAWMGIR